MTWVYGLSGLAAVIAGLRWLLGRGDEVHTDLREIRASRRGDGGGPEAVNDMAGVPPATDVGRPSH